MYRNCLYTVTPGLTFIYFHISLAIFFFQVTDKLTVFAFILEFEESEENEELNEVEEKNHVKTGEKQTKQKDLKKRRAKKSLQDDCRTCTQCEKSFTCKHHLDVHLRVHTEEKPYTCGKSFTQKGSLTAHMRVHTGEKLFICNH